MKKIINGVVYSRNRTVDAWAVEGFDDSDITPIRTIKIEDKIDGTNVSIIKSQAFVNCQKIQQVYLPKSIYTIGDEAFLGCIALTEINLDKVLRIGEDAFKDCLSLEKVDLSKGVELHDGAFQRCDNLKEVIFGEELPYITKDCFFQCRKLSNVKWPKHCDSIESFAFAETQITQVDLMTSSDGDPVWINAHAFFRCKKLSKVYIDVCNWNRFNIHSEAFDGGRRNSIEFILTNCYFPTRFLTMKCDFMIFKDTVTLADTKKVTKRTVTPELLKLATNSVGGGEDDEMNYDILTSRTAKVIGMNFTVDEAHLIPPFVMIDGRKYKVTEISDYAFAHFKDMTEIAIPNTVTYIGDGAFQDCKNLEVFVFGNPSVGRTTFKNCKRVWEWNTEGEYFIDVTEDYTNLK